MTRRPIQRESGPREQERAGAGGAVDPGLGFAQSGSLAGEGGFSNERGRDFSHKGHKGHKEGGKESGRGVGGGNLQDYLEWRYALKAGSGRNTKGKEGDGTGTLVPLYGVEVKYLQRQVKRNAERFPGDFAMHLPPGDVRDLRCQNATSKHGGDRCEKPRKDIICERNVGSCIVPK